MAESDAADSTRRRQRLANVLGAVAGVWLIGGLVYVLWTRLSYPKLTFLGKGIVAAVCLTGIAFAISAMWPSRGQGLVHRDEMADFWSFVRGPEPELVHQKALWRKMRRTVGLWCVLVVWMSLAIGAGLSGLLYR